jgi:hypothetical protein
VACAWIRNSEAIACEHYRTVTKNYFEMAA